MNARTSLSPLYVTIIYRETLVKIRSKTIYAQFNVTWPDPFATSGSDSTLQKIPMDLGDVEHLRITTANPIWVTSANEIRLGVP
jgi:hypothetical protein